MSWNIVKLNQQIAGQGISIGRCPEDIADLQYLLAILNDICEHDSNIPEPQIDTDGGDFELCWINVKRGRWASFKRSNGEMLASWLNTISMIGNEDESLSSKEMLEVIEYVCKD